MLRRRPVRRAVGPRELVAVLTLVAACALSLGMGSTLGGGISDALEGRPAIPAELGEHVQTP